ncbi:MAG: hydroxylamine reductase [Anaerolineae bacterium]|nr:hydroxylamine reductase [Anaerolineae bacterium]
MFCYQCQETARNRGCAGKRGVCGKTAEVATLQDLATWLLKGIAFYGIAGRKQGIEDLATNLFVAKVLFATITNANFDPDYFVELAHEAIRRRDALKAQLPPIADAPEAATWRPQVGDQTELLAKGIEVGLLADESAGEDVRSLRHLLLFGLEGLSAYIEHAYVLDYADDSILIFLQEALVATLDNTLAAQDMVGWVLKCGEMGVQAMALLDAANTGTYGHPEPTQTCIGVRPGPAILVSGHDLRDLDELLQQTEGKGVNVYTHGEMLPANAYPALKKYPHLVGNYGGSWWRQDKEFATFNGPILLTTNCLVPPKESYLDRLWTTGQVGWPGVPHIPPRQNGGQKDFSAIIARALECDGPTPLEEGTIPNGFARHTVMSVADKVIKAVKSGAIKRFVVMAGCDGRHKEREYYTELAAQLPADHVILTAGCAKYRYNKLDLGDIGGIPRVLDAGQCNDSYSLAYIALQLKEAFGLDDINDLPISYDIAWYEQKAVLVLLALLSLGVKHIRLGPTLPAFISPGVLKVLVEHFDIKPIGTVEKDLAAIVAGQ